MYELFIRLAIICLEGQGVADFGAGIIELFTSKKNERLTRRTLYKAIGPIWEANHMWLIITIVILFGVELLARSFYIKRQHPGFSFFNAIFWRWYDLFLLLPFWRSLRIIPVVIRLDHAQILNLHPLRQQIHQGIIANFAEEITEIVVVRVINQIQGSIQRGELKHWLSQNENVRSYIDINNINEVEAIGAILVKTIVYQVLPKIQPEVAAVLRHNIESIIRQAPIYRNLQSLPGLNAMQTQLSEQLATQITTHLYSAVVSATEDPVGAKLSSQLVQRFSEALGTQMQEKHVLLEIQNLLIDFLEEIKLNYVQRLSQEDMWKVLEQTKQLRTQLSVQPVLDKNSTVLMRRERS
ncbi:MAG: cytochrome d ubiquinol oxidase subunit II [Scytonema sp. CRU_2_7]|nr:cytochrome d ubiquinol oxidase subunit II [Scytonema sp. CRU_2_7]